jgi:hypothetical protein
LPNKWALQLRLMMPTAINHLQRPVSIVPLVILRVVFGVLMLVSTLRFMANGWVETFYIAPQFHFTYLGFDWVKPLSSNGMWLIFLALCALAICIALGLFYRVAIALFFVSFTYVELLDEAYYLNHYYFVSVLSFLLIWLPLHRAFSLDVWMRPHIRRETVPFWMVFAVRGLLAIVYVYAGLAKLQSDWLLEAQPLKIWLRANRDFPILGEAIFGQVWFAYVMSWGGAIYDLTIVFFLTWRKSRWWAYLTVIIFHLMTALLFNIGMFPFIMIGVTLVFFDERDFARLRPTKHNHTSIIQPKHYTPSALAGWIVGIFLLFQVLFPWRYVLYGDNVLWTQEGFRFGWRVMLTENTGFAVFQVYDPISDKTWEVYPSDYLTDVQERQMSFQPDMVQQFAHFLAQRFAQDGYANVQVRAEVYASFNGRPSRLLIDPTIDLAQEPLTLWKKSWIVPFANFSDK